MKTRMWMGFFCVLALVGCGADDENPGTRKNDVASSAGAGGKPGETGGSGGKPGEAGGSGGEAPGDECERKAKEFTDFVAAHRTCTADADCAVVGDCGPNLFVAVQADVTERTSELQAARCDGDGWDGPVYDAVCVSGSCDLRERTDTCCGCLPAGDAGH